MATAPISKNNFRLDSSCLFLTYPQCSTTPEHALTLLVEKLTSRNRNITEYIIASEKHVDGHDHLHVFLKLNKRLNITSASFYDLANNHGNYQACRSPKRVQKYCTKDGNFIADPPYIPPVEKEKPWQKALSIATEGDVNKAMESLATHEATCRDLILHRDAILKSFTAMQPIAPLPSSRPLTDFGELFTWDRTRILILSGDTNTGKTTLATSLLPKALFVRHMDRLGDLREGHDGIIFDDMSFKHYPDEAQIHVCDTAMTSDIHIRYRMANIPAGTPRIITTNKKPWEVFNIENPAIARRTQGILWYGRDKQPSFFEF